MSEIGTREYRDVEVDAVRDAWWTAQRECGDVGYPDLLASVRANGVLVPIIVTECAEGYYLVAGTRRLRAARECGLVRVPAIILGGGDTVYSWAALAENLYREDLNPVDLARILKRVVDTLGITQEALAARLGKSASWVTQRLGVLGWPADVRDAVGAGRMEFSVGRELAFMQDHSERAVCVAQAVSSGCTARQAAEWRRQAEERRVPEIPAVPSTVPGLWVSLPRIPGAVCFLCAGLQHDSDVRAFPACTKCIIELEKGLAKEAGAGDVEGAAGS